VAAWLCHHSTGLAVLLGRRAGGSKVAEFLAGDVIDERGDEERGELFGG